MSAGGDRGAAPGVRPMRPDDLPRVLAIDRAVGWSHAPDRFQYLLEDEGTRGLVAERAGEVAGFAFAGLREPVGWIGAVAVAPAHRRQGVGTALVAAADAALRADPLCDAAILEARHDNAPALALYSRLGFVVTGEGVLCGTPRGAGPIPSPRPAPPEGHAVAPLAWADFQFLYALDAEYYGGWRDQDLRYWLTEGPDLARLLRVGGQPAGYCLVERAAGRLGPVAAPTLDGFLALIDDVLASDALRAGDLDHVSLRLLDPDPAILAALAARNLRPVPALRNLRLEKVYRRPARRLRGYYASARSEKG